MIALVCIAKDEDNYIKEWYEYYHKIGFDEIFIYENNWRYEEEVPNYVHLIPFDGEIKQLPAYNDFINNQSKKFDWALFIDADEFFVPKGFKDAVKALDFYKEYYGVAFNWKIFGSNGIEKADKDFSVVSRFTKSQCRFNKHIKTALNFKKMCENFIVDCNFCNPHFVGISMRAYFTMRADLMKYVMGPWSEIDEYTASNWDKPYIAHYITKSKQEFFERRSKKRADIGEVRTDLEEFWKEHDLNEVENFEVVNFSGGPAGS